MPLSSNKMDMTKTSTQVALFTWTNNPRILASTVSDTISEIELPITSFNHNYLHILLYA